MSVLQALDELLGSDDGKRDCRSYDAAGVSKENPGAYT